MKLGIRTAILSIGLILAIGLVSHADEKKKRKARQSKAQTSTEPRVVYPKRTDLDFEGIRIEGELRNPGEFYFQYRPEEKFDSLVKRRGNFHREMLRDVVLTK